MPGTSSNVINFTGKSSLLSIPLCCMVISVVYIAKNALWGDLHPCYEHFKFEFEFKF